MFKFASALVVLFFSLFAMPRPAVAVDLTGIVSITANFAHTCAVGSDATVRCWGRNNFGQLGDGTGTSSQPYAVEPLNLSGGVRTIAAGEFHTCASMQSGGVKCWGQNYNGEVGDGTVMVTRLSPVDVKGLAGAAIAVATGANHSCALLATGRVQCWGLNQKGQLGDGTTSNRSTPVTVLGLEGVVAISAGGFHTCALTNDDTVACWGFNDYGQLGNNSRITSTVPVPVTGLAGVKSISVGYGHTCALVINSKPKCWGLNDAGQVGDPSRIGRIVPTDVAQLGTDVRAISAGRTHTCAITGIQYIACWGSNISGESAIGNAPPLPEPTVAIATGWSHSCAVGASGAVRCTGSNQDGQIGSGGAQVELAPVPVVGLDATILAVTSGSNHSCALSVSGAVSCWGAVLRSTSRDDAVLVATPVAGLSAGVVAIEAGGSHTCALMLSGTVKCWGTNSSGQLGNGIAETNPRAVPVDVVGLSGPVVSIAAGAAHTCVLTSGGAVQCWGSNVLGQLGDGSGVSRATAAAVAGLHSGMLAIAAGGNHTCAITTNGAARCWGSNSAGQIGDGTTINRPLPQLVLASGVRTIAAGASHTCAVLTSGTIRCWGANNYAQLGDNSLQSTGIGDVAGLVNPSAIAAGADHTCALTSTGRMQCWGAISNGRLGINTLAIGFRPYWPVPINVVGLAPGVKSIAPGDLHTCAVTSDNRAMCWGYNSFGQVGNGSAYQYATPATVVLAPVARVVEFYNPPLDAFFVTADTLEGYAIDLGGAGADWIRTGGSFRAGGDTPVCRFYGSVSPGPNSHFYTVDPFECDVLRARQFAANDPRRLTEKSWNFESYDFRSTPATNGLCKAGTEPIYRAYNNGSVRGIDSNHRLTRDTNAIGDLVRRGWISEGVKMCAPI